MVGMRLGTNGYEIPLPVALPRLLAVGMADWPHHLPDAQPAVEVGGLTVTPAPAKTRVMLTHPAVLHGLCPTCGHYGDSCRGRRPRTQSPRTIARRLTELLRRMEENDFSSPAEDRALRTALLMVRERIVKHPVRMIDGGN